jgi:hypothetical protein
MKSLKFLILGAAATGLLATSAMAANNEDTIKQNITSGLNKLVQEHHDSDFLKEKAALDIKFITPSKDENSNDPENMATLIANACKVILVFDKDGNSPKLSSEESILKTTEFKNEKQKEIMREFIALHESFHCEFTNIENPIKIAGKSAEFNKQINYYLKEMITVPIEGIGQIGYIDNLNENFADIAATGLLIKKYGEDNQDLKYVLNANKTQRHAQYFDNDLSSHLTHIGLNKSLDQENISKLKNTKNGEELKEVSLEIANKSIQQLMTQRKDLTEQMLSEKAFFMGVTVSLIRYMNYSLADDKQRNEYQLDTNWKDGITRGFHAQFSRNILSVDTIKDSKLKFTNPGSYGLDMLELVEYSTNLVQKPEIKPLLMKESEKFNNYVKEFKSIVYSQNEKTIDSFDDKTKEEIAKKMLMLRTRFLDSVGQNNKIEPK